MKKCSTFIDTVDEIISTGVKKGILHLSTRDIKLKTNSLMLNYKNQDKQVVNFGSCSYLGLEFDRRMIESAKEAVDNYGTQFSASRAYISARYYEVLENLFDKIFGAHTVVTPTTTLGHITTIPVLIGSNDAVILDHQVHHSVHTAVNIVKTKGVYTELIRHNRIDILEDRIKILRKRHKRIWYLADGIYSMFGDASPVNDVISLLNRYPEFHYYVDDAHGMSCFGKHGRGFALSENPLHERMVVITSLAKAFATGGAVLVFPDKELARKVRTCGGPLITSGPLQPATLGAAIASANIHLSPEIYSLQETLRENIKYTNMLLKKHGIPLVAETSSPIFFVGVSLPKIGYGLVQKMMMDGFYLNLGIFPAVPIKNTGVRFTITCLHTFQQIEAMTKALSQHLENILGQEGVTEQAIYQAFKLPVPIEKKLEEILVSVESQARMKLNHVKSITLLNKEEWDIMLGEEGSFNWDGLSFLEKVFTKHEQPEHSWEFDYIIVRDTNNKPVLATFLTTGISKDDMLSPPEVSGAVENVRISGDHYYLTSKVVALGSMLTAGNHLYLDRSSPLWKNALEMLLNKLNELQEKYGASVTLFRDINPQDEELGTFLSENGYFKTNLPDNHVVEKPYWNTQEEFLLRLSKRSKRHIRQDVFRHENKYETKILENPSDPDIDYLYSLYRNVKKKCLELNTFDLPRNLFKHIASDPNWEILTLTLLPKYDHREKRLPVAVMFNYKTRESYNFMIVGIDYDFQKDYKCYRQSLFQVIKRAGELNLKKANLGYTASIEKKKFGSKTIPSVAYIQTKDNFSMEVIGSMNVTKTKRVIQLN